MTLITDLAERIHALGHADLTPVAIANAKTVILDTVGCTLAGTHEPVVETMLQTEGLATPGHVSLLGRDTKLDVLCAALVNGAASHALDFDDVNIAMGGHPSAPVLPALFAIAESQPVSGMDFMLAFIVGFETETRMARAVNFHHYDLGWHPTATLGVFGAAAASAKLLGLDVHQTALALSLSASLASGVKANFGTMTKPYHVGHAARHGLMAAKMAQNGFTASLDVLEARQGFLNVYNGKGNYQAELITQDWAAPLDIVEPGIGIKLYPCCDSTHATVDALFSLQNEHGFKVDDVESIDTRIHPLRLTHVNRPQLRNSLDAKFSVQYCAARALLDGGLTFGSFDAAAYNDPVALSLMARVNAAPHADLSLTRPGNYLTEVEVKLRDGRKLNKRMDRPFGRHADEPAPAELIRAKYDDCAGRVLSAGAAVRLHDAIMALETLTDLSCLCTLWTPSNNMAA
ncbi:MmgE/PrpD family protein [Thalassospira profundimaris]|uniref:MmgE/PrpD family protein n=1 Tax=Thalassospira profundimaris TaxID=502049 RepID=UPI000DED5F50|nr:MmgE/PrpD family protein [Thalassospira profundimaris]